MVFALGVARADRSLAIAASLTLSSSTSWSHVGVQSQAAGLVRSPPPSRP